MTARAEAPAVAGAPGQSPEMRAPALPPLRSVNTATCALVHAAVVVGLTAASPAPRNAPDMKSVAEPRTGDG
jgi:hypothetical protein